MKFISKTPNGRLKEAILAHGGFEEVGKALKVSQTIGTHKLFHAQDLGARDY